MRSSTASGNGGDGIAVFGESAQIKSNRADANGFGSGLSDLSGRGILGIANTIPPVGSNSALGNDDPAECLPASLC